MVSFADLRAAVPDVWRDQAAAWTRLSDHIGDRRADVQGHRRALGEVWQGRDADAARAHADRVASSLRTQAEALRRIGQVLRNHADQIDTVRRRAEAVVRAAGPTHDVRPDGTVVVTPFAVAQAVVSPVQSVAHTQRTAMLAAELAEILTDASAVDARSALALRNCAPASLDGLPTGSVPSVPGAAASPADVARWWGGLDDEERELLLATRPAMVGRLDGVPAVDRDRANRTLLPAAHEEMANERDALLRLPDDEARAAALAVTEEKARALDAIGARLTATTAPAYLLGLETVGTGRAIVAIGNPDTADNVVTYVPGTGARLGGSPGDLVRADALVASARLADPMASTAAIAWVGYQAPQARCRAATSSTP